MKDMQISRVLLTLLVSFVLVLCACQPLTESTEAATPRSTPRPTPTTPAETPAPASSLEHRRAQAYMGVIDELTAAYGEGAYGPHAATAELVLRGLAVVRLIDFDGDGICELFCAYDKGTGFADHLVLYGYDDQEGLYVAMAERRVSNPGTDVSPSVTFLAKNGLVYLVDENEMTTGDYYTLQGREMVSVLSYYDDFWDGENYLLNGDPSTEQAIITAIQAMESGGEISSISFYCPTDDSAIIKTQSTIAEISAAADRA